MSNAEPRRDLYSGLWNQGPLFVVHDIQRVIAGQEMV